MTHLLIAIAHVAAISFIPGVLVAIVRRYVTTDVGPYPVVHVVHAGSFVRGPGGVQ